MLSLILFMKLILCNITELLENDLLVLKGNDLVDWLWISYGSFTFILVLSLFCDKFDFIFMIPLYVNTFVHHIYWRCIWREFELLSLFRWLWYFRDSVELLWVNISSIFFIEDKHICFLPYMTRIPSHNSPMHCGGVTLHIKHGKQVWGFIHKFWFWFWIMHL